MMRHVPVRAGEHVIALICTKLMKAEGRLKVSAPHHLRHLHQARRMIVIATRMDSGI